MSYFWDGDEEISLSRDDTFRRRGQEGLPPTISRSEFRKRAAKGGPGQHPMALRKDKSCYRKNLAKRWRGSRK